MVIADAQRHEEEMREQKEAEMRMGDAKAAELLAEGSRQQLADTAIAAVLERLLDQEVAMQCKIAKHDLDKEKLDAMGKKGREEKARREARQKEEAERAKRREEALKKSKKGRK
jgi:hypothetical protein